MVVKLYYSAEDALTSESDSPAAGMRYFGEESANMQPLEDASESSTLAITNTRVLTFAVEADADLGVVEAVKEVFSVQEHTQHLDVLPACGIEAGVTAVVDALRLRQTLDLMVGRSGIIDDRQGVEVTQVGGVGDAAVLVEIGHALVHGSPEHLGDPVSNSLTANPKFTRLVDHRLDAQNQAELVVHFQPVVLDAMLDPGPGPAIAFAVGEHFAVEVVVQAASEKGQDVLGGEVHRGVIEKTVVEFRQFGAAGEQDVGAVFGLLDDPVVTVGAEPRLTSQGIDLVSPTIQLADPTQVDEPVGELLGLGNVIELSKRVVGLGEAELAMGHLACQPVVPVDIDLDRVGEPRLQADVDQAEVGVKAVVIEDALGSVGETQLRASVAVSEFDGAAGFLAAQNGHQTFAEPVLADQISDELFLAASALQVQVRSAGGCGGLLGVQDQGFGLLLQEGQEIFAPHLQSVVDEIVEGCIVSEGQISLENDSIKALQNGYNRGSELAEEIIREFHGRSPGVSAYP